MHKPGAGVYLLAAERVGKAPESCLFVDDLRENCDGAKAVGMIPVLHRDPEETIAMLERPARSLPATFSPALRPTRRRHRTWPTWCMHGSRQVGHVGEGAQRLWSVSPAAIRSTPIRARATPARWIRARRSPSTTRARRTVTIGNSEPPTATSERRPLSAGQRDQRVGGGVEAADQDQHPEGAGAMPREGRPEDVKR